jgi:hypothetical protein
VEECCDISLNAVLLDALGLAVRARVIANITTVALIDSCSAALLKLVGVVY